MKPQPTNDGPGSPEPGAGVFETNGYLARHGVPERVIERWGQMGVEGKTEGREPAAGEVLVTGPIVSDTAADVYNLWGINSLTSPAGIRKRLQEIEDSESITVRVNSPGGDVWAAADIVGMLDDRAAEGDVVNCNIAGLAASAAALIALCGEKVEMNALGILMIHRASTGLWGNAPDLRKAASLLDKIDGQQATYIAKRTELSKADAIKAIEAETWYEPSEALELGLIDSIREGHEPDADGNAAEGAEASARSIRETLAARAAVFTTTGVQ